MLRKLELGCGDRPTEGYLHQDIIALTTLDFMCNPWEVDLPENSLDEVIAVGVMEHLRFEDFNKTIAHIHKILKSDGIFLFDVPDLYVWSKYLYRVLRNKPVPFEKHHILNTIWGWQRWPGDEHKSGWTSDSVYEALQKGGFSNMETGAGIRDYLRMRGIERNRFSRLKTDVHIYVKTVKR